MLHAFAMKRPFTISPRRWSRMCVADSIDYSCFHLTSSCFQCVADSEIDSLSAEDSDCQELTDCAAFDIEQVGSRRRVGRVGSRPVANPGPVVWGWGVGGWVVLIYTFLIGLSSPSSLPYPRPVARARKKNRA